MKDKIEESCIGEDIQQKEKCCIQKEEKPSSCCSKNNWNKGESEVKSSNDLKTFYPLFLTISFVFIGSLISQQNIFHNFDAVKFCSNFMGKLLFFFFLILPG